jgi:hypothetical protein
MSLVKIQGNASGTGEFTIAAPNSNTNRTLTLPDNTGTILTSATAGSVLQVVSVKYSTQATIASTSYVDTGLSASITPSSTSSKILVLVTHTVRSTQSTSNLRSPYVNLLRDSTQVFEKRTYNWGGTGEFSATGNSVDGSIIVLDSPSTTSSVTYKTQGKLDSTASSSSLYFQNENTDSTITLMEIAA